MSELGTVEKKSLVARFSDESMVKIVEDPAMSRLIVELDNFGSKYSAPVDLDGELAFSFINISYVNTKNTAVIIAGVYTPDDYGVRINDSFTINANTTYANNDQLYEYDGNEYFYQIYTTATVNFENLENCYADPDNKRLIIIDPSVNAKCIVKLS